VGKKAGNMTLEGVLDRPPAMTAKLRRLAVPDTFG